MATAVKDGLCTLSGARRVVAVDNTPENHHLLGEADWIVEAVVENLEVKRRLMARLDEARRPGTLVTTNTSGLPIRSIAEADCIRTTVCRNDSRYRSREPDRL